MVDLLGGNLRSYWSYAEHFKKKTFGNDHMGMYMLQSMIADPGQKTRFQIKVEVDYITSQWIRPRAGRAASGHDNWALLDPNRIAGVATTEALRNLPGLFHVTPMHNVANIIQHGLRPGCQLRFDGGVDVHFSPFPPHDHRNLIMRKKMGHIQRTGESFAVISVDPRKCASASLRYCNANGILLSNSTVPTKAFDCVWSFYHDGANWQTQWVYEECLENINVIGHRQGFKASQ